MRKALLIGFVSIWVGGFAVSILTGAEKTKAPGAAAVLGERPAPAAPLKVEDLPPPPPGAPAAVAPTTAAPNTGLGPATSVSNLPPPPPLPDVTGFGPSISLAWPEGDPHRPPRNRID